MRRSLFLVALLLMVGCRTVVPAAVPDLILTGGRVFTADPARPWAEAIAISGDRIVAAGASDEIRALGNASTRVIELSGRLVVPGLNDAHVHVPWEQAGAPVAIADDASVADAVAAVAAAAGRNPKGAWLTGPMPIPLLDDPRMTRDTLDAVAPEHPVALINFAGHTALLNSAALLAWKIKDGDPDPPAGRYGRNRDRLNGWLFEYALWRKQFESVAQQSDELFRQLMRTFADEMLRYGVTSVQSMPGGSAIERVQRIAADLGSPLRWRWMKVEAIGIVDAPDQPMKYILDGTPIERGTALRRFYADNPAQRGHVNFSDQDIRRMIEIAARSEQPLLLHVSGDRALEKAFAAMEAVTADWPSKRVRIEHGDFISAFTDQAKRFGVVVVQNPSHFMFPEVMTARFGPDGMRDFMMFRSLIDRGVLVAIGSDGPPNPWLNILFATMHPTNPAEAMTREQALIAYTRGSAYAEFTEKEKGMLAPGMLADLAVLSQDIFTVPPPELPKTESVMTIVGGKIAYQAPR